MEPFLMRLLIGALVIFIGEALIGVIPMDGYAKNILNIILIVGALLYVLFGNILGV